MAKNWKYIKKLLEKEFLCEKLKGHITYDLTDYKPAPWYQQHFIMKYDDEVLLDVSQPARKWDSRYNGTEITWGQRKIIVSRLYKKHHLEEYDIPMQLVDVIASEIIDEVDKITSQNNCVFGVQDVINSIGIYLHSDIETSLEWGQDAFVNALAILDRRCGKRSLEKYAGWEYTNFPDWLKRIYTVRFEAEGIPYQKNYITKPQ